MTQTDTNVIFSRDELVAEIDRGAKRAVGMSAREFARAYREHHLPRQAPVADLIVLLNLLQENDPLFDGR